MGAGALGLGALGLGLGLGGKGGSDDQSTPQASQWQQQIAMDLYRRSNPIRNALFQNSEAFLGLPASQQQGSGALSQLQATGGKNPMFTVDGGGQMYAGGSPGFYQPGGAGYPGGAGAPRRGMDVRNTQAGQAFKYAADSAFQNALSNTTGRFARGGPLQAAVTNLEAQRAGALTQGYGQLYDAELARAFQLGTGMIPATMGGLGQAGSVEAQIAQANAAQNAAGKGALGSGLGAIAGGYFGSK